MDHIGEFSDRRYKSWCIQCGTGIGSVRTNNDHVPSKSLLEMPYPEELPTVKICTDCNTSFSRAEEYFAAFLGAVLSGSTDPESQKTSTAARIFRGNNALKKRIDSQRQDYTTLEGTQKTVWNPEMARVRNVIVKNARGHVYYELGQPAFGEPSNVGIHPLEMLSQDDLSGFLAIDHGAGWPEVGSRMMTRVVSGQDMEDGWIVVQDGIYRFAAVENDGFLVRIIIQEYLAAEVRARTRVSVPVPDELFHGSIPSPLVPLSTLRPRCRQRGRMTRGQDGSLLLSCGALASPTSRRFIPALSRRTPQGVAWDSRPRSKNAHA